MNKKNFEILQETLNNEMQSFQIPESRMVEKINEFHSKFTFEPLERGYGITIGNALRRVILSAIEGYAIQAIQIENVKHEFSTIEGVVEDVQEILLNLKKIRLKKISSNDNKIIAVKVENQKIFEAGQINNFTEDYEVLNPKEIICNLSKQTTLNISFFIQKGVGYVTAEDHIFPFKKPIGLIMLDTIFTPVKNVKYHVETVRVKDKIDYEKLVLDIETDQSVEPTFVLEKTAKLLIKHFILCFGDKEIKAKYQDLEEDVQPTLGSKELNRLLQTPIQDLNLSVRSFNCLQSIDVKNLGDIAKMKLEDLDKIKNFGIRSKEEIIKLLKKNGLHFGMEIELDLL